MAAQQVRETIDRYIALMATGPASEIAELYAPDAVVEDPIGSDPRRGAAIEELYAALDQMEQRKAELHTARVNGSHAAFWFTLVTEVNGHRMTLSAIDVMEFDDAGRIVSMRAYWDPAELRFEPL
ncbi:nuclear transport factor 2 family protein [Nocardia sp. alder85J]|uniref:nuclear transport factor 2 family protein n=1 Tax=Nocardia sp. alder85J TaxID=2862949 RepID=UPI001CD4AAEB|nr:nuclear transport factor 2 family protein [Nocardia sp. alder85J]MCX4097425.1 nuclear transport factor 2 family protein [Nocardia sp. alder85J]